MTTTIDEMAEAQHDALSQSVVPWSLLSAPEKQSRIEAMRTAIRSIPQAIIVHSEHGTYVQELASARDSLLDEFAAAHDEMEAIADAP